MFYLCTRSSKFCFHLETLESRRLLAAGHLDPVFGVSGHTELTAPGSLADEPGSVIRLTDGKFLATIHTYDSVGSYQDDGSGLARFHPDGSPDTTFGPGGIRLYDF